MLFESNGMVYLRPWRYKKAKFFPVSISGTQIPENMVIFVCASPSYIVNSHANSMELKQNVDMHIKQKFCEYYEYTQNTFRANAFKT